MIRGEVMGTKQFSQALAVFGLPLLAATSTYLSLRLFLAQLKNSQHTIGGWIELLATASITLLASTFCLWWTFSLAYSLALAITAKLRGQHQLALPSWVPTLIKGAATGALGISLLASPSYASPASLPAGASISQLAPSPFFQQTPAPTSSPLFASQETHQQAGQDLATLALPPAQGMQSTTISIQEPTALSPLFGSFSRQQLQQTPTSIASPKTYTVAPGDTLWHIAETLLPPEASGQEVLTLVHTLQDLNRDSIPHLNALIYPGQTLLLPQSPER